MEYTNFPAPPERINSRGPSQTRVVGQEETAFNIGLSQPPPKLFISNFN
jgi:hypothetical protein